MNNDDITLPDAIIYGLCAGVLLWVFAAAVFS
jgi:hypothetical protein